MTWGILSLVWILAGPATLPAQIPSGVEDITDTLRIVPPWLPASGNFRPWEAFHGQPLPFDFDNDGDLDLLFTAGPRPADSLSLGQNRLYRQDDSGWVDITVPSGLDSLPPAGNGAVGDINGDGFLDLYLCMLGRDYLLLNEGGLGWHDITDTAGIFNSNWSTSAVFLDADHDGDLDIYVANFIIPSEPDTLQCFTGGQAERTFCSPELYDAAPNRLFINDGTGQFSDGTTALGAHETTSRSLGTLLLDADGDGYLDLFVLSYHSPNLLYRTRPGVPWQAIGLASGLALAPDGTEPVWSQATAFDADRDGATDVILLEQSGRMHLLLNDGFGHFSPGQYQSGLFHPLKPIYATGATPIDLDFDGALDLLLAGQVILDVEPGQQPPGRFPRQLVSTRDGRFRIPESTFSFPLDTSLLQPRPPEPEFSQSGFQQPEGPLFDTSDFGEPHETIETSGMLDGPYQEEYPFPGMDYGEAFTMDDSVTATGWGTDTIQVHQAPAGYVTADLNNDGMPEIIATYPVGLIRIWRLIIAEPPPFLGLYARAGGNDPTIIGAIVTITHSGQQTQLTVVDNNPLLLHLPAASGNVNVEVRWPDGLVNHYTAGGYSGYYTLNRGNPNP